MMWPWRQVTEGVIMGRVYEHLTRGIDPHDLMEEECQLNFMELEGLPHSMTDESLEEYAYDYEREAKKKH